MRWVKPALTRSLLIVIVAMLLTGCRERPRDPPPATVVVDDCRYTVRRPERKKVRVWDGRFLDEEEIPCFGRSRCLVGSEDTRVYASAPDRLTVEVAERRFERPILGRPLEEVVPHNALHQALVGNHAVALIDQDQIEVLWLGGEARFPRPPLRPGEAYAAPVVVEDGLAIALGEHARAGLPVRPLLWLKAPSAHGGRGAAPAAPLIRDGLIVGELLRQGSGWRVSLSSGVTVDVPLASAVPPSLWLSDDNVVAYHRKTLVALSYDGKRHERALKHKDQIIEVNDAVYLLGLARGVERITPAGVDVVIAPLPQHDLGGQRLEPGAKVDRLHVSGDDERRIAVVERVLLPGCRVQDRLHIVDVDAREVTTLARDDRVRLHPRFSFGKLHFTEADAVYEVIGL